MSPRITRTPATLAKPNRSTAIERNTPRTNARTAPTRRTGVATSAQKRPKTGGRQKGTPNKITVQLREAVVLAANIVGSDGQGKDGIIGYLVKQAKMEPRAYMSLLGRVIPLHIQGHLDHEHRVLKTKEEVREELKRRGVPLTTVYGIEDWDIEGVRGN